MKIWLVLRVMGEVAQIWGPLPIGMDECIAGARVTNDEFLIQQGRDLSPWLNLDKPDTMMLACVAADEPPVPREPEPAKRDELERELKIL